MACRPPILSLAIIIPTACLAGPNAYQRLAGREVAPRVAGMELTDAVHWGLIFGRNGKLTSVENGSVSKNTGTWQVTKDKLCLTHTPAQPRCYEVWVLGRSIHLVPDGDLPVDGVLQRSSVKGLYEENRP